MHGPVATQRKQKILTQQQHSERNMTMHDSANKNKKADSAAAQRKQTTRLTQPDPLSNTARKQNQLTLQQHSTSNAERTKTRKLIQIQRQRSANKPRG